MEMILLDDYFPVYKVKNFYVPFFNKKSIINTVIDNKKYYDPNLGYNYPIKDDPTSSFKNLYQKFLKLCKKNFSFTIHPSSKDTCWIYLSDKKYFKEYWHNHLYTSTINSVYYLNIPKNDYVTISFELNGKILSQKINNYELLIFPNYLNHKPNRCHKNGYRISVNMEIICNEDSEYVFNSIR